MNAKQRKLIAEQFNSDIAYAIDNLQMRTKTYICKKYGILRKDYKQIEQAVNEKLLKEAIPNMAEAIRSAVTDFTLRKNGIDPDAQPDLVKPTGYPPANLTDEDIYNDSVNNLFYTLHRIPAYMFRDRVCMGESYDIWFNVKGTRTGVILEPGMMYVATSGNNILYKIFDSRVNHLMDRIREEKNKPNLMSIATSNNNLAEEINFMLNKQ